MKKLLLLLLLIPTVVSAQKTEIELGTGIDHEAIMPKSEYHILGANLYGRVLFNMDKVQLGAGLEMGPETFGYGFLMPNILVNYKFDFKPVYVYTGMMAGAVFYNPQPFYGYFTQFDIVNYCLGMQGGIMLKLGRHWGLNLEAAARATGANLSGYHTQYYEHMTSRRLNIDQNTSPDFFLSAKLGVRCRF